MRQIQQLMRLSQDSGNKARSVTGRYFHEIKGIDELSGEVAVVPWDGPDRHRVKTAQRTSLNNCCKNITSLSNYCT